MHGMHGGALGSSDDEECRWLSCTTQVNHYAPSIVKPRSPQQLKVQYGLPRHFAHPFLYSSCSFFGTNRKSLARLACFSAIVSLTRFFAVFAAGRFKETAEAAGRFIFELQLFSEEEPFADAFTPAAPFCFGFLSVF
eukprot:s36_g19.t1